MHWEAENSDFGILCTNVTLTVGCNFIPLWGILTGVGVRENDTCFVLELNQVALSPR